MAGLVREIGSRGRPSLPRPGATHDRDTSPASKPSPEAAAGGSGTPRLRRASASVPALPLSGTQAQEPFTPSLASPDRERLRSRVPYHALSRSTSVGSASPVTTPRQGDESLPQHASPLMVSLADAKEMLQDQRVHDAQLQAQLQQQLAENEQQRREIKLLEARVQELTAPTEVGSAQQVEALMARLGALHAAKLLSDEELFAMEDCIADFLEARAASDVVTAEIVHANAEVMGKLHKLVALSEGLPNDAAFARQLRRKFV